MIKPLLVILLGLSIPFATLAQDGGSALNDSPSQHDATILDDPAAEPVAEALAIEAKAEDADSVESVTEAVEEAATDDAAPDVAPEAETATDAEAGAEPATEAESNNSTTTEAPQPETLPMVTLKTTLGDIAIELYPDKAPDTVANFLNYVTSGFYNGTIFHRVIDGFMIQGGGFTSDMDQKSTRATVKNEAANGLKNARGTIAMARTSDPHSASAQFFINVKDNDFLNYTSPDVRGYGYCVFGKVVAGMEVVDKIKAVRTTTKSYFENVPVEPVVIVEATTEAAR